MKHLLLLVLGGGLVLSLTAMTMHQADAPPKQVYVCHFDGAHTSQAPPYGDYVLIYRGPTMPLQSQIDRCLTERNRDGMILHLGENAARNGHRADLLHRIDDYP